MDEKIIRNIMCIDLKSFFASCECVDRSLDPFKIPLVVSDKKQGNGAITLAITPALKKLGIPSRVRLYDIPKNIKYEIVPPRMKLYMQKSQDVVSIYLDYVSEEDLHIYSIDECFLDVTDYLKLYKKTDYELAQDILKTIEEKTGLTANCGIGPNMLLAKIAMDTEAKLYKNGIAKWTYEDIPTKLWNIKPLSKMWGIGLRMEKNLNHLNIYSVKDLANYDKYMLKQKFGIIGLELWNHANGIDNARISDFKKETKDKSYSHSQVLFKDYNGENIKLIISEMADVLARKLRLNNKECLVIGFGLGYSKDTNEHFYHSLKLDVPISSPKEITNICLFMLDRYYNYLPIRKVSISCGNLIDKTSIQLNLFEDIKETIQTDNIYKTIDKIKEKYGKNSLIKASSLLPDSTEIDRNKKIGGHHE